jgi:predicted amidohydrolase YtcJ
MCTPTILDRMARLGIVAVPQPNFVYELGDSYRRNFTPEQLALSYPNRAWFDRGIVAVGSPTCRWSAATRSWASARP